MKIINNKKGDSTPKKIIKGICGVVTIFGFLMAIRSFISGNVTFTGIGIIIMVLGGVVFGIVHNSH